jgi:hypothetical protein
MDAKTCYLTLRFTSSASCLYSVHSILRACWQCWNNIKILILRYVKLSWLFPTIKRSKSLETWLYLRTLFIIDISQCIEKKLWRSLAATSNMIHNGQIVVQLWSHMVPCNLQGRLEQFGVVYKLGTLFFNLSRTAITSPPPQPPL